MLREPYPPRAGPGSLFGVGGRDDFQGGGGAESRGESLGNGFRM